MLRRNTMVLLSLCAVMCMAAVAKAGALSTSFINVKGQEIGTVMVRELERGVLLTMDAQLPKGTHGVHLHESGECVAPDFKSAGGHFNPESKEHGYNNPQGFHRGDLPNIYVQHGSLKWDVFIPDYTLQGEKGLLGRAIVIHHGADDFESDPAGHAGARIACAAIGD